MGAALPPADLLIALGERLSAVPRNESELDAVVLGVPVEVRLTLRDQGSSTFKWTEIGVPSKDLKGFAFEFTFNVRPTEPQAVSDARAGRLRDIVIGDPAFDEAFTVEAAPEEVVRLLFDEVARAEMLALRPVRVLSTGQYAIMIERYDWVLDEDVLERLTRLAARLGAGLIPSAIEASLARRRQTDQGYRAGLTNDDVRREWSEELAKVNEQARLRRRRGMFIGVGVLVGVVAGVAAFIAIIGSCSN